MDKILCSKYVQSDVGLIYRDVKDKLNKRTKVLFCGCPCQVDALKTYLKKDYDNLLLVDLLCHGVPSPMAYRYFLKDINPQNKPIKKVNFRSKDNGWGTLIKVDFADDTHHYSRYNERYMKAFCSGLNMRMSCYTCSYSTTKRVGDITLGDFWGAKKEHNDGRGTSLVLAHNSKGVIALENIKKDCKLYDFINYEDVLDVCQKTNGALISPTWHNKMRKCFFNHIKSDGFLKSVSYAEKSLMDVGILGWWIYTSSSNYGSTLTAFALERYCASLGLSTAFISPPNFDRKNAGSFNHRYNYRMTMQYTREDMWKNNQYFKTYIVGSDVLWDYDAMMSSAGYNFLLDFAGEQNKKIAYATSFGNTKYFFPDNAIPYAKSLFERFDAVSTRENNGVKVLKEKFDINATQVVDPVFLCDIKTWNELANNAKKRLKETTFLLIFWIQIKKNKVIQQFSESTAMCSGLCCGQTV